MGCGRVTIKGKDRSSHCNNTLPLTSGTRTFDCRPLVLCYSCQDITASSTSIFVQSVVDPYSSTKTFNFLLCSHIFQLCSLQRSGPDPAAKRHEHMWLLMTQPPKISPPVIVHMTRMKAIEKFQTVGGSESQGRTFLWGGTALLLQNNGCCCWRIMTSQRIAQLLTDVRGSPFDLMGLNIYADITSTACSL